MSATYISRTLIFYLFLIPLSRSQNKQNLKKQISLAASTDTHGCKKGPTLEGI